MKELRLRAISSADAANAFAPVFIADYNDRFGRAPASPRNAHRPLRPGDDLGEVLHWKEHPRLTNNLAVRYQRSIYIVESTPAALAARGQIVDIHELLDGTVEVRHQGVVLPAAPFRKAGEVRQQDVADNTFLASILERLRQNQIAEDERALAKTRGRKREKAVIAAAIERRRA